MTETLESVITAIRRAFTGVERGTMSLHEAELHDGGPDDDQLARARCLDTESSWEQVPDTAIEECRCALSYLDPVSWRFYVPAYMSWSLRHLLTSDSIVKDYTIYTFLIFEGFKAQAQERFRALDQAQSRAVRQFLRYMAANDGSCDGDAARRALEQTWGRFCA